MAVGNAASASTSITLAANLPPSEVFSYWGWCLIRSYGGAGAFRSIVELCTSIEDKGAWFATDGSSLAIATGSATTTFGSSPSTGIWFFFAVTDKGGASGITGYWAYPGDNTFTTISATGDTFTPGKLTLLSDISNEEADVVLENFGCADVTLTSDEVTAIFHEGDPRSVRNQRLFLPFTTKDNTLDYINGYVVTVTGSITTELPSGIAPPFRSAIRRPVFRTVAAAPPAGGTSNFFLAM